MLWSEVKATKLSVFIVYDETENASGDCSKLQSPEDELGEWSQYKQVPPTVPATTRTVRERTCLVMAAAQHRYPLCCHCLQKHRLSRRRTPLHPHAWRRRQK
ncbi:hypothetical protein BIW11_03961 [Tropilaelaps mercedesae]|uniref:Uncharacterized protein n=1 Tax=Tropilaelaps mercedesae TaxID=418985 RepID=A0A1V9XDA2_9ACAR|nr:hypothetical protein BIW11_03961 [Tropilaelaps mercedesae]